jgi:ABC-type multidrug transport system permease subunit
LIVGVVAYDLQIIWRTAAATVVTIVVAIACFTAAGLAVASVARSAGLAQTIAIAAAVILSFLSGLYSPGGALPDWADRLAAALPLKPFVTALQDQFNPFGSGNGWDVGALAIMLAWGVVAGVIATITFRWSAPESRRTSLGRMSNRPRAKTVVGPMQLKAEQFSTGGRLPRAVQLWGQIHHVLTSAVRNPGWVFFAVAMPVGLFVFLMWSIAPGQPPVAGVPFGISLAAGMITWGTAVTAFVNTPEAVARQRDLGYLKRLQGTPLRPMNYLLGRAVGAAPIAIVMAAAITEIGRIAFGLQVAWWGIPLATVVLAFGTLTIVACGFVLAAIVPSSTAVTAVGLAILLPVAFFSGVFTIGLTPNWMSAIGSMLPMKPIAASLAAALNPAGRP